MEVADRQIKLKDVDSGQDEVNLAMGKNMEVFKAYLDVEVVGKGCLETS